MWFCVSSRHTYLLHVCVCVFVLVSEANIWFCLIYISQRIIIRLLFIRPPIDRPTSAYVYLQKSICLSVDPIPVSYLPYIHTWTDHWSFQWNARCWPACCKYHWISRWVNHRAAYQCSGPLGCECRAFQRPFQWTCHGRSGPAAGTPTGQPKCKCSFSAGPLEVPVVRPGVNRASATFKYLRIQLYMNIINSSHWLSLASDNEYGCIWSLLK